MFKFSSKRFFRKNGREYGFQPELNIGENEHTVVSL